MYCILSISNDYGRFLHLYYQIHRFFLQKCYPSILTLPEQGASIIAIIDPIGIGRKLSVMTICNILLTF